MEVLNLTDRDFMQAAITEAHAAAPEPPNRAPHKATRSPSRVSRRAKPAASNQRGLGKEVV
jgi:hypothetical protein